MDKVQKIKAEIYSLQDMTMDADGNFNSAYDTGRYDALCSLDAFIDSLSEDVSEDLEEVPELTELEKKAKGYAIEQVLCTTDTRMSEQAYLSLRIFNGYDVACAYKDGANWQKRNLWHDAQGDDLPAIDREVVVFTQNFPDDAGIMRIAIAHRPNPEGWEGKSLSTGKVEHFEPKTYDKGGWNIPDVKYWLDVKLPEGIE